LLKRPIYAGYVEATDWGASLRKGHHEADDRLRDERSRPPDSERLEHKKAVLKLAFGDRQTYVRNEGLEL